MPADEMEICLMSQQFPGHNGFPDFEAVFGLPSFPSCALLANARSASSIPFLLSFHCHLGGGSDGPGKTDMDDKAREVD